MLNPLAVKACVVPMDYFQILLTIHRYQKSDGTKYLMQFINVCQSSLSLFCVWEELHDRNQGMKYHLWFVHNKFKCNRTQKRIDAQTICFSYYMKERQNAILHKIAIRIFNTYRYLSKLSLYLFLLKNKMNKQLNNIFDIQLIFGDILNA